jgi:hypothetical protein
METRADTTVREHPCCCQTSMAGDMATISLAMWIAIENLGLQ